VVVKLSGLFALDSFSGGFVVPTPRIGFTCASVFNRQRSGLFSFGPPCSRVISALLAARLAARWGLVNTMVLTHLASNILLILVPLMPNLWLAVLVLLLRFSINQMDVPKRQSYVMAVVSKDERSAAAGITGVARTTGAAISPCLLDSCLRGPPG
jgi:MFS family permease